MTDPSLSPSLKDLLNGISTDVQLLASQTLALGPTGGLGGCVEGRVVWDRVSWRVCSSPPPARPFSSARSC